MENLNKCDIHPGEENTTMAFNSMLGDKSVEPQNNLVQLYVDDSDDLTNSPESPDVEVNFEGDRTSPLVSGLSSTTSKDGDTLEFKNLESDKEALVGSCLPVETKYELEQGSRILKEVMSEANKSVNWAFMEAVDADKMGLYDYYDRIKRPMWLKKMRQKFDNREYTTITEFAGDFRQMLENCYRYNGPDHYISKRGQRLETMFEQKLSLLSRELREKTSISATSGQNVEEKIISGTRRRKVLVPHDSTALLNQLRLEEKEREREQKRQQVLDKQKEREEFEQTLQSWEDSLLEQPTKDYMRTMWEIPAVGHFLFLCTVPLNLGEVMHWELERCFAMPRESLTMQTVMTSLLSTPYQRTKLDKKPRMPYKVWEEKLRVRMRQWYKVYKESSRDMVKTLTKTGLEEKFFKVVGHKNPLEKKKFHELTFFQRVWITKALCDWCMETQESVREAIECQPVMEQRSYVLGCDADGNTYLHFPQFCGQDLRVYRQGPIKMPKFDKPIPSPQKQKFSISVASPVTPSTRKRKGAKKRKKKEERPSTTSPTPRTRHSRLRQNPKQVVAALGLSDTESTTQSSGDESTLSENSKRLRYRKPIPFEQSDNDSRDVTPVSFRSRFVSLERIRDTPSRESTPAPSPIPTRLTRSQLAKDSSSRASTPNSETSAATSQTAASQSHKRSRGRSRFGGRRGKKKVCRKVQLENENDNSNNIPEANGSVVSNDFSVDMNDTSLMDTEDAKNDKDSNVAVLEKEKDNIAGSEVGGRKTRVSQLITEENSNSSISTDQTDSRWSSQDTAEQMEVECDKEGGMLPKDACGENGFDIADTLDKQVDSSHGSDTKASGNVSVPSPSTRDQSTPSLMVETAEHIDEATTPFKSYTNDGDSSRVATPVEPEDRENSSSIEASKTTTSFEPSEPSTSGINIGAGLPVAEDSNDSASTSAYSVSEMSSNGDEDKAHSNAAVKTEAAESTEGEVRNCSPAHLDIKTEVKSEIKQEGTNSSEQDESSTMKPENGAGEGLENEKVREIKKEVKEEVVEESEDEEPEISEPEPGEFELVVCNLDDLRDLVKRFADPELIIEKKGKKEKIIQPPPRKKCEKELYDRLLFLLNELEPWEPKLLLANKRAKIRLRKEHESYVEEPEPKEDVWSSEEEVAESSNTESDEDSSDQNFRSEEPRPKRSLRKRNLLEMDKDVISGELPEELGISSRGRIRKRRIIPNNIEDQGFRKRRKEPDHSPSPTPNILQKSKSPTATVTVTTAVQPQPQYKAVLNQLHMPAGLAPGKGGFQLVSINNQVMLVSTGPPQQEKKSGNQAGQAPQPTVLAHISGSSQPVALPLSVITALQAQAKLQQQQQQQQQQSTPTTAQSALKNMIVGKMSANASVPAAAPQHGVGATAPAIASAAPGNSTAATSVPVQASSVIVSAQNQQASVRQIDGKLLQQLFNQQQGKVAVTPLIATPQLQGTTGSVASGQLRSQLIQGSNVIRLPDNAAAQLVKTTTQQMIRIQSPAANSSTPVAAASNTAFANLIQAGLMPQAPKVASFAAAVSQGSSAAPQLPQSTANETTVLKPVGSGGASDTSSLPAMGPEHQSGKTASEELKPATVKQISPELLTKLGAQGATGGKQPSIAAMIQANPGLFKTLASPPKQKYASNITVKSLLEKRALENLRQKGDQSEGSAETSQAEEDGNRPPGDSPSPNQAVVTAVSAPPSQAKGNVAVASAQGNAGSVIIPETQVVHVQAGDLRKVQLTPQKLQPQQAVRAQQVQQPTASVGKQQPAGGQPQTVLTIQQNFTQQQIQLLQQQLAAKFGAQNVPQNIQIVQQVPSQPLNTNDAATQNTAVQQPKQIKTPSGTLTIQSKVIPAGSSPTNISPKSAIDDALKTVMTAVQTSLPTAQIKVSAASPFSAAPRSAKGTITTSAMKSPIVAVPAGPPEKAASSATSEPTSAAVSSAAENLAPATVSKNTVPGKQMTVHNLLLQQQQMVSGNAQAAQPAKNSAVCIKGPLSKEMKPVTVQPQQQGASVLQIPTNLQPAKNLGKVPLSPKTKVSSVPYTKPQTIQQIIESKAKASNANKQANPILSPVSSPVQNKPPVVMPSAVVGSPVRVLQSPPSAASSVAPASAAPKPISPAAGSTMTTVMATIGGKSVQLRVAVGPGQNINQILQSPQLQQQLQQLHQKNLLSAPAGKPGVQSAAPVPQPQGKIARPQAAQPQLQGQPALPQASQTVILPQVNTVPGNINVVKAPGGKTIGAGTGINQQVVPTQVGSNLAPAASQVLSAKSAASRAVLASPSAGSVNAQVIQSPPGVIADTVALSQTQGMTAVQPVNVANVGQGKMVLMNVGGQIMAAQNVAGKTVLVPQGLNLVGQTATGIPQGLQPQLVTNVQPKILAAPQTISLQPLAAQQPALQPTQVSANVNTLTNNNLKVSQTQPAATLAPLAASAVTSTAASLPTSVPLGGLMMVGSGLTPVPTTQQVRLPTPGQPIPGTVMQVSPSASSRHSMPQQIQMTKQAVAVPSAQPPDPGASTGTGSGGLEQLALAAVQLQEAMQYQTTSSLKTVGGVTNVGSNHAANNVNAQSNENTVLTNGTSLA